MCVRVNFNMHNLQNRLLLSDLFHNDKKDIVKTIMGSRQTHNHRFTDTNGCWAEDGPSFAQLFKELFTGHRFISVLGIGWFIV